MRSTIIQMAVLALILIAAPHTSADFEAGQSAWDAGNVDKAVSQWRDAADAGDRRAMLELGRLYRQGLGVVQDYVEAHKWLNLAASRGEAAALEERDALAAQMTPAQVAMAQQMAAAWQPGGAVAQTEEASDYSRCDPTAPAGDTRGTVLAGRSRLPARPGGWCLDLKHGSSLPGIPARHRVAADGHTDPASTARHTVSGRTTGRCTIRRRNRDCRDNANPRPISSERPSPGLAGCSAQCRADRRHRSPESSYCRRGGRERTRQSRPDRADAYGEQGLSAAGIRVAGSAGRCERSRPGRRHGTVHGGGTRAYGNRRVADEGRRGRLNSRATGQDAGGSGENEVWRYQCSTGKRRAAGSTGVAGRQDLDGRRKS